MAPVGELLRKWYDYYRDAPKENLPIISANAAAGLSILCTLIYVLPFYISSTTRPSPNLTRDSPTVIRARSRAVTFSAILSTVLTIYLSVSKGNLSYKDTFEILGWWPINVLDVSKTLALIVLLFLGPLFEAGIVEGKWRSWVSGRGFVETLRGPMQWRTYVTGPITEEVVFRSVIIALHLFARVTPLRLVFLTPLYFGIAHIHHFYEFTLTHPNTPFIPALSQTVFQFAYTSIFGFYAAFIYLRTGSLLAAIFAHIFCNVMGLPRFWGRVSSTVLMAPAETNAKREDDADDSELRAGNLLAGVQARVSEERLSTTWTVAYYVLLVAGAIGFYINLMRLTKSANALVRLGAVV